MGDRDRRSELWRVTGYAMWIAQEAAIEATSELERLSIPLDREVDIFSIIEDAGLPLIFRPLKRLFGAYIPADPKADLVAGIIIHAGHPRSLQRYTAAHEYAHYISGGPLSLDEQTEILGRTAQMQLPIHERFAEIFASWFLMPIELVTNLTRSLEINMSRPSPPDIYQLSLTLGTSYAATITQLVSLKMISPTQARQLRSWQPKQIKEHLSWDELVASARNDIWVINKAYKDHSVHPRVGDELYLHLPETPSTGYIWEGAGLEPKITLVSQRFVETETGLIFGAEGQREFKFCLAEAGRFNLSLSMQRPWLGIQSQVDEFRIELLIEGERLGINPVFLLK